MSARRRWRIANISTKPVDIDYTHKKQSGGSGQFGRVKVKVTPGERGSGIVFKDEIKGGNIPKEYIPSVEKGMRETAATGFADRLPDHRFRDRAVSTARTTTSTRRRWRSKSAPAARCAKRRRRPGIKLLEPIMKVEVVTPEDYLGDVIGDMNSRRGQIQGTDSRGNAQTVEAMVPLANMFGYVNQLRSFTQGRAQLLDAVLALRRSARRTSPTR